MPTIDALAPAIAATDATTADFQAFITRYAWDGIWNRPGLERRDRSIVTLAVLVPGARTALRERRARAATPGRAVD